jgi:uncharacterized protein (TIGR04255 family)
MSYNNYKNSPLNEVVFEVKLETVLPNVMDGLREICQNLEVEYPNQKKKYTGEFSFNFGENEVPSHSSEAKHSLDGFFLYSQDEKRVLHLMQDGFAISILRPYTGWDDAFASFMQYWKKYSDRITPKYINRMAVRSINVIPNVASREISEYISLDQGSEIGCLLGFFDKRIFSVDDEAQFQAVITKTVNETIKNQVDIILDIDVSNVIPREYGSVDIQSIFESIRSYKNKIFESIITEKSRSYFN